MDGKKCAFESLPTKRDKIPTYLTQIISYWELEYKTSLSKWFQPNWNNRLSKIFLVECFKLFGEIDVKAIPSGKKFHTILRHEGVYCGPHYSALKGMLDYEYAHKTMYIVWECGWQVVRSSNSSTYLSLLPIVIDN